MNTRATEVRNVVNNTYMYVCMYIYRERGWEKQHNSEIKALNLHNFGLLQQRIFEIVSYLVSHERESSLLFPCVTSVLISSDNTSM
jgi:hypothetical protein